MSNTQPEFIPLNLGDSDSRDHHVSTLAEEKGKPVLKRHALPVKALQQVGVYTTAQGRCVSAYQLYCASHLNSRNTKSLPSRQRKTVLDLAGNGMFVTDKVPTASRPISGGNSTSKQHMLTYEGVKAVLDQWSKQHHRSSHYRYTRAQRELLLTTLHPQGKKGHRRAARLAGLARLRASQRK